MKKTIISHTQKWILLAPNKICLLVKRKMKQICRFKIIMNKYGTSAYWMHIKLYIYDNYKKKVIIIIINKIQAKNLLLHLSTYILLGLVLTNMKSELLTLF